jgi:anhydro-N-acetylmuramic acid kinase
MSGTSIDGVDYALCEIDGKRIVLRSHWSVDFPRTLRHRLHTAARGEARTWELAQLHHDLGRFYARHAVRPGVTGKIAAAGLHGQTVFHNPSRSAPATLQIGEPAWLAEALRTRVVSNFRAGDIAAGGQGAPLATMFHQVVFAERGKHICVNNLGGISNVTSLDWRGDRCRVVAFDTGPANVLIDMAMRHFTRGRIDMDKDGRCARKGKPCEAFLTKWLKNPYFRLKPPKSTGRELFGEPFFEKAIAEMRAFAQADAVATFTEFTARSLALNYALHLPAWIDKIVLTGGGAANPSLVGAISRQLATGDGPVPVFTSAEVGWPPQTIEPAAFALLAWLRLAGRPGNLPETTGASRPALLGQVTEF